MATKNGKPRVMVGIRLTPEAKKQFAKWGGRDKLEAVLHHWDATQKGKAKAGAAAA